MRGEGKGGGGRGRYPPGGGACAPPTFVSQAAAPKIRRCALSELSRRTSGTTLTPRSGSQVVLFACARATV